MIAEEDGERLTASTDISEGDWSHDEDYETEHAGKYARFFARKEDNDFAIFCELGLDRAYEAKVVMDNVVNLIITIPLPPDALLAAAGFPATHGHLQEVKESFSFKTPRKIVRDSGVIQSFYPTKEIPEWVVFKLKIEDEKGPNEITSSFKSNIKSKLGH